MLLRLFYIKRKDDVEDIEKNQKKIGKIFIMGQITLSSSHALGITVSYRSDVYFEKS